MAKISKTAAAVRSFIATAKELGWGISLRGDIVSIHKAIARNNSASFAAADGEYMSVLTMAPMSRPGSIWGTDGGSVGGHSAMKNGSFVMNMSGVSKRFLTSLRKELAA